jgi:phage repressor protein C with HTH and peptisase S24 domain
MVTHKQIWNAIDALAARNGHTASGLARAAGLDATAFNKSKRVGPNGKQRWPSTESVAKVLAATGASLDSFAALTAGRKSQVQSPRALPVIGFAQAGADGYFDDAGFPVGSGWDEVSAPEVKDEHAYALEISGDSMLPAYRHGTVIVVSPGLEVRKGDRVVVRTVKGEVMAKELAKKTARKVELKSLNPDYPGRSLDVSDIDFIARIVWASQ